MRRMYEPKTMKNNQAAKKVQLERTEGIMVKAAMVYSKKDNEIEEVRQNRCGVLNPKLLSILRKLTVKDLEVLESFFKEY